jgi:hypothetical protein
VSPHRRNGTRSLELPKETTLPPRRDSAFRARTTGAKGSRQRGCCRRRPTSPSRSKPERPVTSSLWRGQHYSGRIRDPGHGPGGGQRNTMVLLLAHTPAASCRWACCTRAAAGTSRVRDHGN